jgi:hypothetical protein
VLVFDEWHLEVLVPPGFEADVADRLSADLEAAVHQVADDLTARLRSSHRLPTLEIRASQRPDLKPSGLV